LFYTYYDLKKPKNGRHRRQENITTISAPIAGVASIYCIKAKRGYYFKSKYIHEEILFKKSKLHHNSEHNYDLQRDFNLYGPDWFRVGIIDEIIKSSRESEAHYLETIESRLYVSLHEKIMNAENPYNKKNVITPIIFQRSSVEEIGCGRKFKELIVLQDWRKRTGVYVITNPVTHYQYINFTTDMHQLYAKMQYRFKHPNQRPTTCTELRSQYALHGKKFTWEFLETTQRKDLKIIEERLSKHV
jgi:hypothetical protein